MVAPATAREALAQLLRERPGGVVKVSDVCERLGRHVSRNAVSKAAGELGRDRCRARYGRVGGYVSLDAS